MAEPGRKRWSSRGSFLLATTGAAVGLGNVWRFPFLVGENGGAAFVLVYLAFAFLIGVPVITAELALGRMGHQSPIGSVKTIIREQGAHAGWQAIGVISLLVPFLGFTYYSIVAGWSLYYTVEAARNAFDSMGATDSQRLFQDLAASPWLTVFLQGVVIGLTAVVVGSGLHRGIERATKVMMPSLVFIMLIMIVYNVFAADVTAALAFLFTPDFSQLTSTSLLLALGQAFFSVGVGVGFMMTYGAYLPREVSVPHAAFVIAAVDTVIALLAGLVIFPIVFASNLNPAEGPGLVFVTMPVAFGGMGLGHVIGVLFFLLLSLAAYTTTLGMLEPIVSYLEERWQTSRRTLAVVAGGSIWIVGFLPALSDNVLADIRPLSFIGAMSEMSFFGVFDFVTASVLLPINALLIALFSGWVIAGSALQRELAMKHDVFFTVWQVLMRYIVPVAVLVILISGFIQ